jgi:hypothetical protein
MNQETSDVKGVTGCSGPWRTAESFPKSESRRFPGLPFIHEKIDFDSKALRTRQERSSEFSAPLPSEQAFEFVENGEFFINPFDLFRLVENATPRFVKACGSEISSRIGP